MRKIIKPIFLLGMATTLVACQKVTDSFLEASATANRFLYEISEAVAESKPLVNEIKSVHVNEVKGISDYSIKINEISSETVEFNYKNRTLKYSNEYKNIEYGEDHYQVVYETFIKDVGVVMAKEIDIGKFYYVEYDMSFFESMVTSEVYEDVDSAINGYFGVIFFECAEDVFINYEMLESFGSSTEYEFQHWYDKCSYKFDIETYSMKIKLSGNNSYQSDYPTYGTLCESRTDVELEIVNGITMSGNIENYYKTTSNDKIFTEINAKNSYASTLECNVKAPNIADYYLISEAEFWNL